MVQREKESLSHLAEPAGARELLSTKLASPRLRSPLLPRQALRSRLDEGLDLKLTLVSAPAGFGKTTLAAEWISKYAGEQMSRGEDALSPAPLLPRSPAASTPAQFAWVSLDAGDNDPVRFWRYVLSACQAFAPDLGRTALTQLQTSQQPPFEAVLTGFINQLARLPGKYVLVLEDYHTITSRQVHETVAFLLEYLPPALHLVMLTRSDPPLPLARLRAQNELNELRAADLRFSIEEIQDFLREALPFTLSEEAVSLLAERTEGWAAGLRLVALALQGRREPWEIDHYLATFTGSHRPILEYLVADVFNSQPEPIQEFLLKTSILSRLTGDLCDAVIDEGRRTKDERGGRSSSVLRPSSEILEEMERTNLFIVPLDGAGQWYRYHELFAEAMRHYARQRLGEARLREMSLRASRWYEDHDMLAEAIEAALSAQDFTCAAGLIQRIISPRLVQNEFVTLRRWMENLPEEVLRAHPKICMTFAVAILFTSDRHSPTTKERIETPLEIVEEYWRKEGNQAKLGEVLAFKSLVYWLQRELERAFSTAREALALLPADEVQWRGISMTLVCAEEFLAGRLHAARRATAEALALCEAAENIYGTLDSMLMLGKVYDEQGELHQAAQLYRRVLSRLENASMHRDQALMRRGQALAGLAALALEWNDLEAAVQDASEAAAISGQFPEEDNLAHAPLVLARVKLAQGETEAGMQLVRSLVAQAQPPLLLRQALAYQARLSLAVGDLASARRWSDTIRGGKAPIGDGAIEDGTIPVIQKEQEALLNARLLLVQGEAREALHLLEGWLPEAQAQGRTRSVMGIKILTALSQAALGDAGQAGRALTEALALAHTHGFQRTFLDEGRLMAALLRDILPDLKEDALMGYARALLYTINQERTRQEAIQPSTQSEGAYPSLERPQPETLWEPLSDQELRVLRLLAAGLSNPEIASELIVSVNTVKTHIKSIYRKLEVGSRKEAREAARQLKII